jgi:hypothetical protein
MIDTTQSILSRARHMLNQHISHLSGWSERVIDEFLGGLLVVKVGEDDGT